MPRCHRATVHGLRLLQGGSVGLEHFEGVVAAAASALRSRMNAISSFSCDAKKTRIAFHGRCLLQGGSVGLEHFEGVVSAATSAMRSPLDEDLSVSAAWMLQSVAKRLAEAPRSVSPSITQLP